MTAASATAPAPPRAQPTLSVVVCAFDEARFDQLVAAVASVALQTRPPLETIVVVDHNADLLHRVEARLPEVIALDNTHAQGLAGARNRAVEVAEGDVLAFLDDDAVAAADWLERLSERYNSIDVLGVGGGIDPRWLAGRPRGFPDEFAWVVGCTYEGMPTTTAEVRNLIGANMSVRRDVFARAGGFDPSMGRIGKRPLGCEETELCIRARRTIPGGRFVYEPAARVIHDVPAARTSWDYFRARCYSEGLSKARVAQLAGTQDGLASERSYAMRTLPAGVLRGLRDAGRGDRAGLVRAAAIVAGLVVTAAGYLSGRARAVLS